MNKAEIRAIEISLVIFLTLVIMNSIKFVSAITSLGSIGKFLFVLVFIGGAFAFVDKEKIRISTLRFREWAIVVGLILFFAFVYMATTGDRYYLMPNIAFPLYFIFYFLLIKLYVRLHPLVSGQQILKQLQYKLLSVFRTTLWFNFVFWFPLAILFRAQLFEESGGFGGFFEDEIHFGLYMVTGFLVSLYFRFNTIRRDRSYFNTFLLFLYGGTALFTSRNAFLIIVAALFYYYGVSKIKKHFYRVASFVLFFIGVNAFVIIRDINKAKLIEITSGRYQIWLLAFEEMYSKGKYFVGSGLFNLNDVILRKNKGVGFYYLDDLDSLSFHNSYIELLAAGGIIAFVFLIIAIGKTWKKLTRIDKSIVASILVGASFESFLVQPFILIAVLFYMILIINTIQVKVKIKKKKEILVEENSITTTPLVG